MDYPLNLNEGRGFSRFIGLLSIFTGVYSILCHCEARSNLYEAVSIAKRLLRASQ